MTYKEDAVNSPATQEEQNKEEKKETRSSRAEQRAEKQEKQSRLRRFLAKPRVRLVPIWARLLGVLVLLICSLIAGLLIGYIVIGDGDSLQVLNWKNWQALYDFMMGK
ncbi:DNA-directed RNA polymerase subunit beta [Bacillus piscicola]|uniref:DNA-directed RNA polymerase subunit beta n=1 Tax=Bacillus piscicola TaxID=1632684 RepID=UPI001F08B032|nr:DNA-directed RNA polymerase subunit beta [Bacillus piscicola]